MRHEEPVMTAPEHHPIESQTVAPEEANAAQHDFAAPNNADLSYHKPSDSYNNLPNTEHNTIAMDGQ